MFHKKLTILLVLLTAITSFSQTKGTRPNVIVILADDLGYGDVGFNRTADFPKDRGVIPTPELDKLANQGIICKNAHVAHPFCGPSRVALLTGMMPHRIGAQYNLPNNIKSPLGVATDQTYFAKVLQDANYNTAAFGKWHLGFAEGKYQPLDRGFDYFFGFLGGGKNYFEREYEDAFYRRQDSKNPVINEYQDPLQRNRTYVDRNEFDKDDYLTDVLTNDAINYIQKNKSKENPFMMYLAYNAPHTPLQAPADEIAKFKENNPNFEKLIRNSPYILNSRAVEKQKNPEKKAALIEKFVQARITYATMVTNLDTNVGKLVAELKKDKEVYNNTIIVFLSDNGGYTYSKGAVNYPLYALKGSVFEGGHKVPMFVHWPNKIKKTSIYPYQISALDLYPTLSQLAGAKIPSKKVLDGSYFMDAIIANKEIRPNDALLILRPQNGFHNASVIAYPWKVVKTGGNGKWKLFDIEKDPGEQHDKSETGANATKTIESLASKGYNLVKEFKDVKPAWFDHERGEGHPHRKLWFTTQQLPQYDKTFKTN
ncbi:arylsulfatase A-like enzyme [Wenyingzhuangia heitensis]|uniref:Arylsulfatase A-like enzyme n=1 Tax=Wenyingzhuangia heitensis TaxID=1487859 RepID=A0ABX0UCY1_9FLAO|nr:sulfatase-like hydrolase/transferase [Wenyingzhuangia heitensis]NIJ45670.1 arylsulfatase A-like enzyme [Wenyingzhuangia heitensis]